MESKYRRGKSLAINVFNVIVVESDDSASLVT